MNRFLTCFAAPACGLWLALSAWLLWIPALLGGASVEALLGPVAFYGPMAVLAGVSSAVIPYFVHRRWGWIALACGLIGYAAALPPAARIASVILPYVGYYAGHFGLPAIMVIVPLAVSLVLSVASAAGGALGALAGRRAATPRGAIDWLLARKRVIARTAVLMAVFGGACLMYREQIEYAIYSALYAEAPVAPSKWDARERRVFAKALASQRYDVLVTPLQLNGPGIDRVARSVMTRLLSARLSEAGLKTPSPSLVMRALGAGNRRFEDMDVLRLARSIGARQIVYGYVARNKAGSEWTLELELWVLDRSSSNWIQAATTSLRGITMSDDLPPEAGFQPLVDQSVKALFPHLALPAPGYVPAALKDALPPQPSMLSAQSVSSPVGRAIGLQLYAILHGGTESDVDGEFLWERSLVALSRAAANEPYAKLLKARAFYHLHRRPYALDLLGEPNTPESRCLDGVMHGNAAKAREVIDGIRNEALALTARIEIEEISGVNGYQERRTAVFKKYPAYYPVMALRFSRGDWFNPELHDLVAQVLETEAPDALRKGESNPLQVARQAVKHLYWQDERWNAFNASRVEESYPRLWLSRAGRWAKARAYDRLAEADYFDLLYSMNREAAVKTANSQNFRQAYPQGALAFTENLYGALAQYPWLQYHRAYAIHQIGLRKTLDLRYPDWINSSRLARDLYIHEGGETWLSLSAEYLINLHPYEKYDDEPMRGYRTTIRHSVITRIDPHPSPKQLARENADLARKLRYATSGGDIVKKMAENLKLMGKADEARKLLAANAGNQQRGEQESADLVEGNPEPADDKAAENALRKAIEAHPERWRHYRRLGNFLIARERAEEAAQVFASYPQFHDENANRVGLANDAADAGDLLYWHGHQLLAKDFYELCRRYRTGAASEMDSGEKLALMRRDYAGAMRFAKLHFDRYPSEYAARSYIEYLFLVGQPKKAWAEFDTDVRRFTSASPWHAALRGHRMAAHSAEEIRQWAYDVKFDQSVESFFSVYRNHFLFFALFTDREPNAQTLKIMADTSKDGDGLYAELALAMSALREADDAKAIALLTPIAQTMINVSIRRKATLDYPLGYLALAHARSNSVEKFRPLLERHRAGVGADYDYQLASAILAAYAGDDAGSVKALKRAYYDMAPTRERPVYPMYQLLEAIEHLYLRSKNDVYRTLLVDFAHRLSSAEPVSWAAAFEALYASPGVARTQALRLAMKLDPLSMRLARVPEEEKSAARRWLAANKIFQSTSRGGQP